MANEYYERLSEMNPGDLADGLAMEAELDAISQAFSKLPSPHPGGQGFDGPVKVGDATSDDEATSLGQLKAAIGEAVLLDIATYGNLAAEAWGLLSSNTYLLFGTGAQFSNTPYTLVSGATYCLQVRHVIGGDGVAIYHDQISLASTDDAENVDLRRLFVRTGSTFTNAKAGGWAGLALKKAALTALESLTPTDDQIAYYTGENTAAMASLTAFARSILGDANAAAMLTTLDIADAYKKRNILGAVSQSAGVPTGAIIERGSNANGEYIKFADGTMICRHSLTVSAGPAIAQGALFRSPNAFSRAYPAVFVAPPVFSGLTARHAVSGGVSYIGLLGVTEGALDAPSATEIPECYYMATNSWSSLSVRLHYIAIGRWY